MEKPFSSISSLVIFILLFGGAFSFSADPLGLVLPTKNDAVFSSNPSKYYMYTDRNFEGVRSKPWDGGKYGFFRNQKRTAIGVIGTRLHEGIDIRPISRDSSGNPLDIIRSIANGTVVYINSASSHSNYGRYIVVHHDWGYGPFFSLYAHLSETMAKTGQRVRAGETIARMGYTGRGIDKTRAHCHMELNMLMNDRFQNWYNLHYKSENHHGVFNGFNLSGMDIAALMNAHRANPNISIPQFLAETAEPYYKVLVPKNGNLEILRRYPWLGRDMNKSLGARSWEFTFARTGIPLEIRPSSRSLKFPAVTWVKPSKTNHSYLTASRISGSGTKATLTGSGSRYIQLISGSF